MLHKERSGLIIKQFKSGLCPTEIDRLCEIDNELDRIEYEQNQDALKPPEEMVKASEEMAASVKKLLEIVENSEA